MVLGYTSLAMASDVTLSLKTSAQANGEHLLLSDVIDADKTSETILNGYGHLNIDSLISDGTIRPTQILLTLARSGVDLAHLKMLSSASAAIGVKRNNGLASQLKSEILSYANKQGPGRFIDLVFDQTAISEIPYDKKSDNILIESLKEEAGRYKLKFSVKHAESNQTRFVDLSVSLVKGIPVILAKKSIMPGEVVTADMVEVGNQGLASSEDYISDLSIFTGSKVTANTLIEKGKAIPQSAVSSSTSIEKGAIVSLVTGNNQFQVRTLGRVKDILDNGSSVLVENIDSKKEIVGKPISANEVKVYY